tara:strand:+ start:146 stop:427 length:282 start_codon:yes stop_codon:yes gene_type:complete
MTLVKKGDLVPTTLFKAWSETGPVPVHAGAGISVKTNWATGSVIVRPVKELSDGESCLRIYGPWVSLRMEPKVEINCIPESLSRKTTGEDNKG